MKRLVFLSRSAIFCLIILLGASSGAGQNAEKVGRLFEKFTWRGIGPAVMGGRTVDIEAVESRPWTIYAAVGPSGIWKSENNGITWTDVFSKEATVSVGDLAVSQSHPDIIWAGTGEATCRNSVTIGDGVYKSLDGGKTWTNMGLKEARHISRILINRGDPNIVYVAAMGHLWGPNPERGVYKTVDGGKSWKKVLYVTDNTGFADLAMDPGNSQILYAAAYEHRRLPYHYSSGGPESGLYRSEDGGETWHKLTKDLPEGIVGRIGIGVARSKPGTVYALIEHSDGGIWRSEDWGLAWKRMCDRQTFRRVNTRPFYYSQILVDPNDDKTVYVLSTGLFVSNDMGQKFRAIGAGIHPDHHALWIDPANSQHLVEGNDGGIDITYDGGKNWQAVQNIDAAEVYQVGYDMRNPYYVYVGLQDNGSWGGPSATLDPRGILNEDWFSVGGGDGFFVKPDPDDSRTVYSNYQMNNLSRYDLRIGRGKVIRPAASLNEPPYRFNWNSPVLISPHDSKTVYTGGNFLFKTVNGGQSWEKVSPDLTTNDPSKMRDSGGPISMENTGAEMHCTIVTIAESPLEKGLIWCGTDDGNLQITRDGGKTWKNTAGSIPGLPKNTWCSRVEASHFDAGTAYASFDGHRTDDYSTYVYKTSDFGKTWKSIRGNLPFGWVHVVREDLKNRNLLFVGTEFCVFASLDGGTSWFSLKNNLPTAAVHDLAVHPRENDLIIGTHGRGVWILDDISFLQEMSEAVLAEDFFLFEPRPATLFLTSLRGESFGKPVFAARNPQPGVGITTWLKAPLKEKAKVVITDKNGKPASELNLSQKEGLQREIWNCQYIPEAKDGKKHLPGMMGFTALPTVAAGEYNLEIRIGDRPYKSAVVLFPDPRVTRDDGERASQMEAVAEVLKITKKMGLAATSAKNIRRHLDSAYDELKKIQPPDLATRLQSAISEFDASFKIVEKELVPADLLGYQTPWRDALRGGSPSMILFSLGSSIANFPASPTAAEMLQLAEIISWIDSYILRLNRMIQDDLPRLSRLMTELKLKPFPKIDEILL